MEHQTRTMSTYPQLLEPTCRRRLPPTPSRRCSSPRMLPTPPPLSPDFRCPSANLLERRPSGRQLPRPPTAEPRQSHSYSPLHSRLTPESITPPFTKELPDTLVETPTHEEYEEMKEDEPEVEEEEEEEIEEDFHVPVHIEDVTILHNRTTPDDGVQSQCSSLSPTIEQMEEQLTSKSSTSDAGSVAEDPMAHGLDPSLYGPGAPTCISPAGSDTGPTMMRRQSAIPPSTVPSSSSFLGSETRPTGLGLLHCTLQHFPVRKRLRVSILKIEALAGQLKPELEINAQCKISIPGLKTGKEQSSEVKRGRDPVFNQEFFFDNVTLEDLDTKSIHVGAYHAGGTKLIKDILIGESTVPLREIRELNTKKEVKVIEEIRTTTGSKKLGKIYITSCIEKEARRLTINLKKADDLPRWGFLGAPDVCVKITVDQGAISKTKCSRVLKSTTTAVYNEAVMFLFNPSKSELENTKITISVHDMQRSCTGDDIIGCAYLGILGQDKSEIEQWKSTVEHMGKEYKGSHHLKQPQPSPTVHVAEADPEDY